MKKENAGISFTGDETLALLEDRDLRDEGVARSIQAKFEVLALSESVSVFRRNLRLLLEPKPKSRGLAKGGQRP